MLNQKYNRNASQALMDFWSKAPSFRDFQAGILKNRALQVRIGGSPKDKVSEVLTSPYINQTETRYNAEFF